MKNLAKELEIETFTIIKKGKIISNLVKKENLVFFTNQININGLTDFHLTIKSGLSNDEKIELLNSAVKNWKKERRLIRNL